MTATASTWIRNAADEFAVSRGCYFDERSAERVVSFFPKFLRHSKGEFAGKPFELQPWQAEDLFFPLFGWKRPDGTRRFRKAFVEMPKKGGKSTTAAGIGIYMTVGDGEDGADVFSTAVSRDQASLVHSEAIAMVEASDALKSYLRVNRSTKEILFAKKNSRYRALPAEANSSEGLNAHCTIMDELHAWKGQHGRAFFESLKYAGRARRQPLQFIITTAGDDTESVCFELYEYAKKVLSGDVSDERFFALIYEAQPDEDWTDPEIWRRVNPSLGVTINERDFSDDLAEAQKTPTALSQFLRYSFNIWTQNGGVAPISPEVWQRCKETEPIAADDELRGLECWAGLDLSRKRDMSALVFVIRDAEDAEKYYLRPFFWLPEGTVRDLSYPEQFRVWAKTGVLRVTPGDVTDYRLVKREMIELFGTFAPLSMAFDPYYAEELTQEVADETGVERVAFPQTVPAFAGPCAEFERLCVSGKIQHDGNPILGYCVNNLRWRLDTNNNCKPIKPKDSKRIDGAVAAIMALAQAMQSVPSDGGLSFI